MRQATWAPGGGVSRRRLLRRSGAALAAAAGASSAGCLSFLPPASQQARYGPVDVPTDRTGDRPTYRKWIPAESALPELDHADGYEDDALNYVTPGDLGADELGAGFDIGEQLVQGSMDYVGYGIEAFDAVVDVGHVATVGEIDVDRQRVRETLAATPYGPAGSYRSFDVYERTDVPRTVAVGDDAIVQAGGRTHRETVETVVDAAAGRIARRHERDETFRTYTERMGTAPTILDGFGLNDDEIEDPLVGGMRFTFDDSSAYFVEESIYPRGEAPDEGTVKRAVADRIFPLVPSRAEVTVDDPYVTIEYQHDESAFVERMSGRPLPFVTWGVEETEATVTVRHTAGDPVPVEHTAIWPADAVENPRADGETIEPGDAVVFDRSALDGQDIEFHFDHGEYARTNLFRYVPTDAET